ncbi:unnamed protein product, partial [Allacma fusca]
MLGSVMVS